MEQEEQILGNGSGQWDKGTQGRGIDIMKGRGGGWYCENGKYDK